MNVTREPLVRIAAPTAAEICAQLKLEKESQQLLAEGMTPGDFVDALVARQRYVDAIDFMSHALGIREGIWWGCLCMQQALGDNLSPPDRAAATCVVQWLMNPAEENRLAAKAQALAAEPVSPAGALAMAVSFTSGSIYPPELPFKPAPPFAAQQMVARAIKLCSIKNDPAIIEKIQGLYVELGIQVAEGRLI